MLINNTIKLSCIKLVLYATIMQHKVTLHKSTFYTLYYILSLQLLQSWNFGKRINYQIGICFQL